MHRWLAKILTRPLRRMGLGLAAALSLVGIERSSAQAQSWHYQSCIANSCQPTYWSCRQNPAMSYTGCGAIFTKCKGDCWASHVLAREAEVAGIVARNRQWRNWNWANRPYRGGRGYSPGGGNFRSGTFGSYGGYRGGSGGGSYGRSYGYGGRGYSGGGRGPHQGGGLIRDPVPYVRR